MQIARSHLAVLGATLTESCRAADELAADRALAVATAEYLDDRDSVWLDPFAHTTAGDPLRSRPIQWVAPRAGAETPGAAQKRPIHDFRRRGGAYGAKVPNGITKKAAKARRETRRRQAIDRTARQRADRAARRLTDREDIEFLNTLLSRSPSTTPLSLGSFLRRMAPPRWIFPMLILFTSAIAAESTHYDATVERASTTAAAQSLVRLESAAALVAGISIGVVASNMIGLGAAPAPAPQRKRKKRSAEVHVCDVCSGAIRKGRERDETCCDCAVKVPCTRCEQSRVAVRCTFEKCKCAACKAVNTATKAACTVASTMMSAPVSLGFHSHHR